MVITDEVDGVPDVHEMGAADSSTWLWFVSGLNLDYGSYRDLNLERRHRQRRRLHSLKKFVRPLYLPTKIKRVVS